MWPFSPLPSGAASSATTTDAAGTVTASAAVAAVGATIAAAAATITAGIAVAAVGAAIASSAGAVTASASVAATGATVAGSAATVTATATVAATAAATAASAATVTGSVALAAVSEFNPFEATTYLGRVEPDYYRAAIVGPTYAGGITATGYQGVVIDVPYRGVIDPEGENDMFAMVVGDRSPSFTATLKNAETGSVVDLSTASGVQAKFRIGTGSWTTASATIVTAASGIVRYDWGASDTATAGVMQLRFVVTFPSALPATFPSDGTSYEFTISE